MIAISSDVHVFRLGHGGIGVRVGNDLGHRIKSSPCFL